MTYVADGKDLKESDVLQTLMIAHQLGIIRVYGKLSIESIRRLNSRENELMEFIISEIYRIGAPRPQNFVQHQKQVEKLVAEAVTRRKESWQETEDESHEELLLLLLWERSWQNQALEKVLGVKQDAGADPKAILGRPIMGKTLKEHFETLAAADASRLREKITTGMKEGASPGQIADSIRGTRGSAFDDGIMSTTRKQVEAVISTAATSTTSDMRGSVWLENFDRITGVVWTSILDERTTDICQHLDGRVAALPGQPDNLPPGKSRLEPPGKRPPAHFRCRSIVLPIIDGQLPRETTYADWLKDQSQEDQLDILGATRFRLISEGRLKHADLADKPTGKPLTLGQLKSRETEVFEKLGL
jgi:hypothetical protein